MYTACAAFLAWISADIFPRSQSSQIPAPVRNHTSEVVCFHPRSLFFLHFIASRFDRNDRIYDISRSASTIIVNRCVQKIGKKVRHTRACRKQNFGAQRHSIHHSVSLETYEYKLSLNNSCLEKSCSF